MSRPLSSLGSGSLETLSTLDGKTFRGRYEYKTLNPHTNDWEFGFRDERGEWFHIHRRQLNDKTVSELLDVGITQGDGPVDEAGSVNVDRPALVDTCLGATLEECTKSYGQPTNVDPENNRVEFANADGSQVCCFFAALAPKAVCVGVLFQPVKQDGRLAEILKNNSHGRRWNKPQKRSNDFEQYLRWERDDGAVATLHPEMENGVLIINLPSRAKEMGL